MPPPLLRSHPFPVQVFLAIVVPAAFGALCGVLLGISETAYLIASVISILGGVAGGFDHDGAGEAAVRGFCGGLLFGVFILVGHSVAGTTAKADLPDPHMLLPIVTTILGIGLHAIGGALRHRHEARRAAAA